MNNYTIGKNIRECVERFPGELNPEKRKVLIASAIARAISISLPLPSSPVEVIYGYYANTHYQTVLAAVASINENYVIDVDTTMKLTFNFYKLRYDVLHTVDNMFGLIGIIASYSHDSMPPMVSEILKEENSSKDAEDYSRAWVRTVNSISEELMQAKNEDGMANPTPM